MLIKKLSKCYFFSHQWISYVLLISFFISLIVFFAKRSFKKTTNEPKLFLNTRPTLEIGKFQAAPKQRLEKERVHGFESQNASLLHQGFSTPIEKNEWDKLLVSIHGLWKSRNPNKKPLKAFISYAWEDLSTEEGRIANSRLQRYLENLRDDLQKAGISVFLDIGAMHGHMKKRMEDNLKASNVIITINTPRFKARAEEVPETNLGFEYRLTLEKAKSSPYGIFPLHYSGDFNASFPNELKKYLIRDCRNIKNYKEILIATQRPLGIIPAIYGLDCDSDKEYQSFVHQWRNQCISKLPPMNPHFTGRKVLLAAIEKSLEGESNTIYQQRAISGLGGIGKSSLVLAYAYKHGNKYKMRRWLSVEGDNIKSEFEQLASELGIDPRGMSDQELASNVYKRIGAIDTWLLVFDNADDYQSIKEYLPEKLKNGQHILITSRSQHWNNNIAVEYFSQEEAVEYITNKLQGVKREEALLLANSLGSLPLALAHAVNYIKETNSSIKSYIDLYQAKGIELLQIDGHGLPGDNYSHNLITTWSLSMEKLEQTFPMAASMLEMCSYLSSDNIPVELFVDEALLKDKVIVNEALRTLKNYSLIESSKLIDHIQINRLVQSVTKYKYQTKTTKEEREALLIQMAKAIEICCPQDKLNEEDFNKTRTLLPHMRSVIDNLKPYAIVIPEGKNKAAIGYSRLLKVTADSLYELGNYAGANELYEKALVINEKHYGKDHPKVAIMLENMGNAILSLGDYASAKELYKKALVINEKHYGKDHAGVAITLENMGNAILYLGDYADAKELYKKALVINEKHYGKDHIVMARTLDNMGNALLSLRDYTDAKELYEKALLVKEKHYGKDHPVIAITLENMGNAVLYLGDYVDAKELYERALLVKEKHYGKDHPEVARTLYNLCLLYEKMQDISHALEVMQIAYHIAQANKLHNISIYESRLRRIEELNRATLD